MARPLKWTAKTVAQEDLPSLVATEQGFVYLQGQRGLVSHDHGKTFAPSAWNLEQFFTGEWADDGLNGVSPHARSLHLFTHRQILVADEFGRNIQRIATVFSITGSNASPYFSRVVRAGNRLYVVVNRERPSLPGEPHAESDFGLPGDSYLYRSLDDGRTWTQDQNVRACVKGEYSFVSGNASGRLYVTGTAHIVPS